MHMPWTAFHLTHTVFVIWEATSMFCGILSVIVLQYYSGFDLLKVDFTCGKISERKARKRREAQ